MTAEKYTFPANYGEFDAVFREYRAIFEKQLRTVCDSFCDNGEMCIRDRYSTGYCGWNKGICNKKRRIIILIYLR